METIKIHESLAKSGVGLGIGIIMTVIFTIVAFGVFYGVNTSTVNNTSSGNASLYIYTPWPSMVLTIWNYIPLIVVAVIISIIAAYAMHVSSE